MSAHDEWLDEPCPRCGTARRDHPECTFRIGSLFCVNDPCPNPHHRPNPEAATP